MPSRCTIRPSTAIAAALSSFWRSWPLKGSTSVHTYREVIDRLFMMNLENLARALVLAGVSMLLADAHAQGAPNPQQPQAPAQNALVTAATNVGIKHCRPALARLSGLALQGSRNNDVLLDWDRRRPDSSPVFSLLGLEFNNGDAAISISAVPEADGSCSVAAERIVSAPFTCASVAQRELAGYRLTQLLRNFSVYTDSGDPQSTVVLIDSPPSCLVIRRYVAFKWTEPVTK